VSTWKVILATLVIFVAGLVTGALVVKRFITTPSAVSGNILRAVALKRLTDDLDLTATQRKEVNEILHESHERTMVLWEFVGPYFQEEYQQLNDELRSVFTPEQRKKFDQLLKQRQRRIGDKASPEPWRAFQPGGGGGGQSQLKAGRTNAEPGQRRQGIAVPVSK
jgi:hypothetical protein